MRVLFNHQPTELQAELTRRNLWQPGQAPMVSMSSFSEVSGNAHGIAVTRAGSFDRTAVQLKASLAQEPWGDSVDWPAVPRVRLAIGERTPPRFRFGAFAR